MSTLNFKDCIENFPLMVMSNFDICKAFWGDEDEEGNKKEEYDEFELQIAYQELFDEYECIDDMSVNDALEELNDKLVWYKVSLLDGYYSGIQLYVDIKWVIDISFWNDEEVKEEFGVDTIEEFKEIMKLEKSMIIDFLNKCKAIGFRKLNHIGTFSNGEGIYEYA